MASLYQRFTGKINTSRSFPAPPEASHLLGGQGPEEDGGAAAKPPGPQVQAAASRERGAAGRPRFQYQARSDGDEEDVSAPRWVGGCGGARPPGAHPGPFPHRSPQNPPHSPRCRISVTALPERGSVCGRGGRDWAAGGSRVLVLRPLASAMHSPGLH